MRNHEYSNSLTANNNNGCVYAPLSTTYMGYSANVSQPQQTGTFRVPKLCASGGGPSYPPHPDTLTHGGPACGGHVSYTHAYPYADCSGCKTGAGGVEYVDRPCGQGYIDCSTTAPVTSEPVASVVEGYTSGCRSCPYS